MGNGMKVLLEPHNDDAVLFATWTCLREQPHVITCLRSHRQGDNFARRELESHVALQETLGCSWGQWEFRDDAPDWPAIRSAIGQLAETFDHCYAPFPRWVQNGHDPAELTPPGHGILQHDRIGQMALDAFGPERYTGYLTYLRWGGKDNGGTAVPFEPEWPLRKLQALACYRSQLERPEIVSHFLGDLNEFYSSE